MSESASYQVAIIGSGAGGKEAAIFAARNGLRVVLIEKADLFFSPLLMVKCPTRFLPDLLVQFWPQFCDELAAAIESRVSPKISELGQVNRRKLRSNMMDVADMRSDSPRCFVHQIGLGGLMQVANVFGYVHNASWRKPSRQRLHGFQQTEEPIAGLRALRGLRVLYGMEL